MKKLYFPFIVITVLLVIGCDDNSITDPIRQETINKDQSSNETIIQGTIPLEGLLDVRGMKSTYYAVNGSINYIHEFHIVDPIPPAPQYYINLNLKINAKLFIPDLPKSDLSISGAFEDMFYVSEEGIYLLEKSIPFGGGNDKMIFVCRFLVTTNGIALHEMWLSISN